MVAHITEGGAAQKSGQIRKGDIVESVDGIVCHGWDLQKVITVPSLKSLAPQLLLQQRCQYSVCRDVVFGRLPTA